MILANLQTRRATVDDLVELRKLWNGAGLAVARLEKRLRDFQIVETPDGILLGALALQIEGKEGRLHTETYVKPEFEAEVRQRLWERAQAVARNCGLYRVWTDIEAPFWKSQGFEPAAPELQKKLPAGLGEPEGSWLVLNLREEVPEAISIEHEFELFTRAQRESSDRIIRQAQIVKNILYLLLIVLLVLGVVFVVLGVFPSATRSRLFRPKTFPPRLAQPSSDTSTNNETSADRESLPAKQRP